MVGMLLRMIAQNRFPNLLEQRGHEPGFEPEESFVELGRNFGEGDSDGMGIGAGHSSFGQDLHGIARDGEAEVYRLADRDRVSLGQDENASLPDVHQFGGKTARRSADNRLSFNKMTPVLAAFGRD